LTAVNAHRHILINGLSLGGAGGYTVARELMRHMATLRPGWTFTIVLIAGQPLHEEMRKESLPVGCRIEWAPPQTARFLARRKYERHFLPRWAAQNKVNAVLQLNGMIISTLRLPTLSFNQNPWPYRPEAWSSWKDRLSARAKRRAQAQAMRLADAYGWTSAYIRDLVCGWHGFSPRRSEIFYNGLPDEWIQRAASMPEWSTRPLEIATISNVSPYKRQDVVIRALAQLVKRPGLQRLMYRIVGKVDPESYHEDLLELARAHGVADRVMIEGRVSEERVREVFSQARCFVLMSVCESFGIPIIEAMSHGTPVVASDCCAMPEVCGDAAVLSPVDDVAALADRIERVLCDPSRANALRRAGVNRVSQFTWSSTASKMAACLEEMTAPGGRRPEPLMSPAAASG
jgi:glycosyltransferase involved in cell wall biosynthesis